MSLDQQVSALTARLRSEFWKAWQQTAEPAPWETFTGITPSTTSIENQILGNPVPAMRLWQGTRDAGQVDTFIYSIENKTYYTALSAKNESIEDDQVGYLMTQPKELVVKAKLFPGRQTIITIAAGATTKCFDGTNWFASSHTYGTGNNLQTFTTVDAGSGSSTSGNSYKLAALHYGGPLKPVLWQDRSGPDFETDAGTPESKKARQTMWWVDRRGASYPGFWYDSILCTISGLPSITEMHTIFQNFKAAYRSFKLPQTSTADKGEYVHEQTTFSQKNLYLVGHPDLDTLLMQALKSDFAPQSAAVNIGGSGASLGQVVGVNNIWRGFADYTVSNLMA